ncbi:hypothetical protein BUE80_DR009433 [Diplocarpon rosae]|nr:hypothetical protein BUE80_DR009433 [Diplocarpon rosae]
MASSLHLKFLRPMALSRPANLQRFLGAAKASRTVIRAESTSAAPLQAEQAIQTEQAKPAASRPYRISLTPSKNYPVYMLQKRGGNKRLTKVRRIEGDITALKKDLQEALGLRDKDVTINQLTNQIMVKGYQKSQIEQFFMERPSTVV